MKEDYFNKCVCTIRNPLELCERRQCQQVEVHYRKSYHFAQHATARCGSARMLKADVSDHQSQIYKVAVKHDAACFVIWSTIC